MPKSLRNKPTPAGDSLRLSLVNYVLMGGGLISIIAGYVMLAHGSIVAAPLLLVLGYVVLFPLGIIR
jgi:hypothetical protein